MDAKKMTRDQLKKSVAAGRKQSFDPKPYKDVQKAVKAFRDSGRALADLARKNPEA